MLNILEKIFKNKGGDKSTSGCLDNTIFTHNCAARI